MCKEGCPEEGRERGNRGQLLWLCGGRSAVAREGRASWAINISSDLAHSCPRAFAHVLLTPAWLCLPESVCNVIDATSYIPR